MEKILKLALIAILLVVGYSFGRPYLEGLFEGLDSLGGGAGSGPCARAVERARDDFAGKMARVTPPVDRVSWNSDLAMSRGRLSQALSACDCPEEGCGAGRDAIDALDRLMSDWDAALQRDGAPPLNGARALERIDELIEQARRSGG